MSTSETASAVTCVSEKSGITINDTASTKALAGSISSQCRQHNEPNFSEDGVSEKVKKHVFYTFLTSERCTFGVSIGHSAHILNHFNKFLCL